MFTGSAGIYCCSVANAHSCSSPARRPLSSSTGIVADSSHGTIACHGGTTTVTVSASGGTAPYTGTGTFTVSAGSYSYTVTDAHSCSSVASGTISEPEAVVADSSHGAIACHGGTTTVTVSATGGTAPYSGTGTFTVSGGSYSYTVTDAHSCSDITSGTINDPSAVVEIGRAGRRERHGGTTTVTVSARSGTAPYTGTGTFT